MVDGGWLVDVYISGCVDVIGLQQNRSAFQLYNENQTLENEKSVLKDRIKVLEAENARIAELEKSISTDVPARSIPLRVGFPDWRTRCWREDWWW
jgi:cell shape-determining protein MreC